MENKEYKEPDTYGSKLRNRLSPFYNIICAIGACKLNPTGITHEMLLNHLFNSVDDLWEDFKKIRDMSYDPWLDKKEYKSTMVDLLGKDCKKYEPYYQVGRQFWYFNENKWKLITIRYKRSGIIFYTTAGIDGENWMPINCIDSMHLVPQTIYLSELPYKVPSFIEFDDYDGLIKINII